MKYTLASGHPRTLVNPAMLEGLRRRAASTHRAEMDGLLDLAQNKGNLPGPEGDYSDAAWRLAFLYLLSNETSHAASCVFALEKMLELPVSGAYFVGARRLKALACAYDWLHGFLPGAVRERVGRAALAYCQAIYDSGEIEVGTCFCGHNVNQIPYVLMAGIAVADELPRGRDYIENILWRLGLTLPGYRFFLEKESFQMSYSYTSTYVSELPYIFQAAEIGLGLRWFEEQEWLRGVVKWWTYALRSDDTFLRHGDYFCWSRVFENPQYYRPLAAIASHYRDPLAQWWVERFRLEGEEPDKILFEERAGAVRAEGPPDVEGLPRTKLFERMGVAVARGDFADGTIAAFKCTPYYLHNHSHRDANQITIYHKGSQALDSGAYDGYETPHWYNYYIRTIAHNTIVVHDPTELMVSRGKLYANDGGQRFVNEPDFQPRFFQDVLKDAFREGQILAYKEGPGHSYVCGDASRCYAPRKLRRFLRHAVFVLDWPHKGAVSLVVMDELDLARPGLTPRFLLHTVDEPVVAGPRIVARQGGGRLTATVLWPSPARIEKIGGPGREFWVAGANYALNPLGPGPHEPGAWRVEVTPTNASEAARVRFLTLLVPADATAPEEAPPSFENLGGGLLLRQGGLAVALLEADSGPQLEADRAVVVQLAGRG